MRERITLREWLTAGRDLVLAVAVAAFVYGCWYVAAALYAALVYEWGRR